MIHIRRGPVITGAQPLQTFIFIYEEKKEPGI